MKKPKTNKPDDPKQAAAFRKAARDLGADAGDDQFKGVLRMLAKAKPQERGSAKKGRS